MYIIFNIMAKYFKNEFPERIILQLIFSPFKDAFSENE